MYDLLCCNVYTAVTCIVVLLHCGAPNLPCLSCPQTISALQEAWNTWSQTQTFIWECGQKFHVCHFSAFCVNACVCVCACMREYISDVQARILTAAVYAYICTC